LGLGQDLVPTSEAAGRNRYLFLNGRLRLLPHDWKSFLASDLLSVADVLSMLGKQFRMVQPRSGDESIEEYVQRRLGRRAAHALPDALVTGIQAGDPALLSLKACFPRIVQIEQDHGGLVKAMVHRVFSRGRGNAPRRRTQMWTLRGGMRP